MDNFKEIEGMQLLSNQELIAINGGENLIEYVAYAIGWMVGTNQAFWEGWDESSGGYTGSKM